MILTINPIGLSANELNTEPGIGTMSKTFHGKNNFNRKKIPTINKVKSKLDTKLLRLIGKQNMNSGQTKDMLKSEMQASGQFVPKGHFVKEAERTATSDVIYVYIKTKTAEAIKNIEPDIFKIVNEDTTNKLIAAWVEVDKLEKLEAVQEVLDIKLVMPPNMNVTSEGDYIHRADMVRGLSNGTDGSGVKVGVISDGVDHLSDSIAKGELAAQTHVLSNAVGGDEGTAMLEIVHDLAPGAELYFHDASTNKIGFNSAVDELAAAGCEIIVDDVGWITEPFFQDGIVGNHVKEVVNNYNINYISAAGNSSQKHYQGRFYNDGYSYHDFSSGTSDTPDLYIHMEPGETATIILQWDDAFGSSNNDYELLLYDANSGNIITTSENAQSGYGDPIETISYANYSGYAIDAGVAVYNYAAAAKTLELYLYANCYANNITSADSIFGQAAVPEVISVGAVEVSSPNNIASYSSIGPVTLINGGVRKKPDICGASGVSITGAGGFPSPFHGTSAAAPHIAAIAALLHARYPSKTAGEIRNLIQNNAVDLGSSGFDSFFGYGRADAYKAFNAGQLSRDINGDGTVNIADLGRLAQKYNIRNDNPAWDSSYDLNEDKIIDLYDLVSVSSYIR